MTSCTCASRYNIAIVPHYWCLRLIEAYSVNDIAVHYRAARSIALLISILSGTEPSHANDQLPPLTFPLPSVSVNARSPLKVALRKLGSFDRHVNENLVKLCFVDATRFLDCPP